MLRCPRFSEQAFSAVDEDKTLKISLIEAAKVPDTIFSTARGACGIYNVIAVRSRVESCFFAASGADELLARREYQTPKDALCRVTFVHSRTPASQPCAATPRQ